MCGIKLCFGCSYFDRLLISSARGQNRHSADCWHGRGWDADYDWCDAPIRELIALATHIAKVYHQLDFALSLFKSLLSLLRLSLLLLLPLALRLPLMSPWGMTSCGRGKAGPVADSASCCGLSRLASAKSPACVWKAVPAVAASCVWSS